MSMIHANNLKHRFLRRDEKGEVTGETVALDGVSLDVEPGQFIAVLGANGSGKSTFARHLNVLLSPTEGTLYVDGKDVADGALTWEIRQTAGMIFQNPDNQIVAGVVEEDVAFGPENLGVPTDEIRSRVTESLEAVDMTAYREHSPNRLSGGQKQRVAIAGVVAMRPKCIIMDEPTAMLDPNGRQEVLKTAHRLNREEGVTVILITHYMEEVTDTDYIFVMDHGKIAMQGSPKEVFSRPEQLEACGLTIPPMTQLAAELQKAGLNLPDGILNREELLQALEQLLKRPQPLAKEPLPGDDDGDIQWFPSASQEQAEAIEWISEEAAGSLTMLERRAADSEKQTADSERSRILSLEHVSYTYSKGSPYEMQALTDLSLDIREGDYIGLIGHTGSGKSTLIQLLNGLLKPDSGRVLFEGADTNGSGFEKKKLRGKVGLVFQYPEHQLFETTVLRDVMFGPKNQKLSDADAMEKAKEALLLCGLSEECWEQSPFDLSGGQKRRAAIAGVLAMNPSVLVLDEPTAGLDPRGRSELFGLIDRLHDHSNMTILVVSHSMEDMAEHAGRIIVLDHGKLMLDGTPSEVFSYVEELEAASLAVPQVTSLMAGLRSRGYPAPRSVTTLSEAVKEIMALC